MAAPAQAARYVSLADYLEGEKTATERHEYYRGEVFAMSGGSPMHSLIAMNLGAELRAALEGRCRVFGSDLKVHIPASGLFTYPDVSVVCGDLELEDDGYTLRNPLVLVEVLSPSTEPYDRGQKFAFYRSIASLREYVLVAQERMSIEVFRKDEQGRWVLYELEEGAVELASVGAVLRADRVYAGVDLPEDPPLR